MEGFGIWLVRLKDRNVANSEGFVRFDCEGFWRSVRKHPKRSRKGRRGADQAALSAAIRGASEHSNPPSSS